MKYYEIDENTLQGVVNYLVNRPYQEVNLALPVLQSLKVIREDAPEAAEVPGEESQTVVDEPKA